MSAVAPISTDGTIGAWLRETDPVRLENLWTQADAVRVKTRGQRILRRGLIHISNHCVRACAYCGLRQSNRRLPRYRLSEQVILACAHRARAEGLDTVVLQAGEDPGWGRRQVERLVVAIKRDTGLAVTLSLGERAADDLRAWRQRGADRYLLKFETSDASLFRRLHPPASPAGPSRFELLELLRELGYELGSGVMVGLPGQSWASLAADLGWFARLRLDMIAIGPWRPEKATPLGRRHPRGPTRIGDQAENSELAARKVLALTRLVCPRANLPATRAIDLAGQGASRRALNGGANVLMVDLTPTPQRWLYRIYPAERIVGSRDPVGEALRWARALSDSSEDRSRSFEVVG